MITTSFVTTAFYRKQEVVLDKLQGVKKNVRFVLGWGHARDIKLLARARGSVLSISQPRKQSSWERTRSPKLTITAQRSAYERTVTNYELPNYLNRFHFLTKILRREKGKGYAKTDKVSSRSCRKSDFGSSKSRNG